MRALFVPVLACLLLPAGCIGGVAPKDRYYRLQASPPRWALTAPRFPGSLRVAPLRADGITRGTALVHGDVARPSELGRSSYHHWVDPPTEMLQLELARFLREAKVADVVLPTGVTTRADWVVAGRILRLERLRDGADSRALLELELEVVRGSDRELVFQRGYREETPASRDVGDAVAAMNRALDAVLARFLADLTES